MIREWICYNVNMYYLEKNGIIFGDCYDRSMIEF